MRLGLVEVFTPDLDEAERFYRDKLDLVLKARSPDQLIFDLGVTDLHVFRCASPNTQVHAAVGGTACAFEVESIDDAMRRLTERGVVFLHRIPAHNALAQVRYAAFHAPGGNVHELIERGRSDKVIS
jgi:catechol 2,3-dioxygenase-like lactoylglutathione lyase family enzyme